MFSRVLVVAVVLALLLVGCTGADEEPLPERTAPNGEVFNTADVAFARDLLVQRSEELALVTLTVEHDLSPALIAVLDDVRTFRTDELTQLTMWLTDWEQEIPETVLDHVNGHHGTEVPDQLEGLAGAEFEQAWIELFLAEISDVVEITEAELERGANDDSRRLAQEVSVGYDDESERLEDLR